MSWEVSRELVPMMLKIMFFYGDALASGIQNSFIVILTKITLKVVTHEKQLQHDLHSLFYLGCSKV